MLSSQGQQGASIESFTRLPKPMDRPIPRQYPNPGYLGSSSHTTLFNQIEIEYSQNSSLPEQGLMSCNPVDLQTLSVSTADLSGGEDAMRRLLQDFPLQLCIKLAKAWLDTGANLSLGHAFTASSIRAVEKLGTDPRSPSSLSKQLFHNSSLPLDATLMAVSEHNNTTFDSDSPRWENVSLFFIAVGRATLTKPCLHPALRARGERQRILRLAMAYACQSLDLSLSMDCLNVLQLVSQHENFLLHSIVDGDQSTCCIDLLR